jgi:hypothetical protein
MNANVSFDTSAIAWLGAISFVAASVLTLVGHWPGAQRSAAVSRLFDRFAVLTLLQGVYLVGTAAVLRINEIGAFAIISTGLLFMAAWSATWYIGLVKLRKGVAARPSPPGEHSGVAIRYRIAIALAFAAAGVVCWPLWRLSGMGLGRLVGFDPSLPVEGQPGAGAFTAFFVVLISLLVLLTAAAGMFMLAACCALIGILSWPEARMLATRWRAPERWHGRKTARR